MEHIEKYFWAFGREIQNQESFSAHRRQNKTFFSFSKHIKQQKHIDIGDFLGFLYR